MPSNRLRGGFTVADKLYSDTALEAILPMDSTVAVGRGRGLGPAYEGMEPARIFEASRRPAGVRSSALVRPLGVTMTYCLR